jgi:hypothetical protein
MKKTALPILASVLLFAVLLIIAWRYQRTLEIGVPPREECATQAEAWARASAYAHEIGGAVVPVRGTGSMAPYIPPAPASADPWATFVAYVVLQPGATFADVRPGVLCIYQSAQGSVMHGAATKRGGKWIMAGLHNSESDAYMGPQDFTGIVAKTWIWRQ